MTERVNKKTIHRIIDNKVTSILFSNKNKKTIMVFSKKNSGVFYKNKVNNDMCFFGFWKTPKNNNGMVNSVIRYEGIIIS